MMILEDELDELEGELRQGPELIYSDPEMQEAYESGWFDGFEFGQAVMEDDGV